MCRPTNPSAATVTQVLEAKRATKAPPQEQECSMTRLLTAVAVFVVANPMTAVCAVGCIHTVVALSTFFYTRDDFKSVKPPPSFAVDVMFQFLYAVTIDAVCMIFVASRSGVRQWHWKICTAILAPVLCVFYIQTVPAMVVAAIAYFAVMSFAYKMLEKEGDVYPVGLSKYIKSGDESLIDLRWTNFRRCMVITIVEAFATSQHMICFMSPVMYFVVHSAYVQWAGIKRSKLSSLYTVTFTSPMDTGMFMSVFDFPSESNFCVEFGVFVAYWAVVHVMVKCSGDKIQRCYALISGNKYRYIACAAWLIILRLAGTHKHNFASFAANLTASLFIAWTTVHGWDGSEVVMDAVAKKPKQASA